MGRRGAQSNTFRNDFAFIIMMAMVVMMIDNFDDDSFGMMVMIT